MIRATRTELLARWSGVGTILFSALARVMSSPSRIPYWDIDPLTSWSPDTTRTPAMSLLFDALVWLAASVIIWAEGRAGREIAWKTGILALIGCVGVALHGWVLTPLVAIGGTPPTHGDFQSMSLGSAWASAIIGAWALSMAARDAQVKRTAAMTLLGVVIVLGAKGAMQVFIEHPRLVTDFNANKDEMLAAQGFQPGSVNARLFERRLVQAEATGWFGLSNVYGSFMAAGCAAFLALAVGATRAARSRAISTGEAGLLWIATAIAAMGLALSGSKGAISAGVIGCILVVTAYWLGSREAAQANCPRREPGESGSDEPSSSPRERATQLTTPLTAALRFLLRYATILLPLLALLAVIIRGLLGERLGELSLYFRWQYLLAAMRIILAHPIFGTGPAGFKDQYLLHKEPTNPEEIDSPHCLPVDWIATMGLFGAAWVILWVVWLLRVGATASEVGRGGSPCAPVTADCARRLAALAVAPPLIIFASLAFSWWAEWAAMLPEMLAVYALAGLAWWLVARTGSRLAASDPRALDIALFGAAIVLGTHCMIEVTGVLMSSVGWVMAVVAMSSVRTTEATAPANRSRLESLSMASASLCAAVLLAFSNIDASRWETLLWDAAQSARRIARVSEADDGAFDPSHLNEAIMSLDAASALQPTMLEPASRASAIELWRSLHPRQPIDTPSTSFVKRSAMTAARFPNSSRALAMCAKAFLNNPHPRPDRDRRSAAASIWKGIVRLDPHGLVPPVELARLNVALGQMPEAVFWAARALQIHDNLHLDPLKGLTDAEKAEMERLASPGQFDENRTGSKPVPPSNRAGAPPPPPLDPLPVPVSILSPTAGTAMDSDDDDNSRPSRHRPPRAANR